MKETRQGEQKKEEEEEIDRDRDRGGGEKNNNCNSIPQHTCTLVRSCAISTKCWRDHQNGDEFGPADALTLRRPNTLESLTNADVLALVWW